MVLSSAWLLTGGLSLELELASPATAPKWGSPLKHTPGCTTMLMPPPTHVTEPTPWVPSCLNVDSDLEHDLGGGLGSLSPGASHSPSRLSSPSLQFRNELSSLTVRALGLVWSNKCSHCCANLLLSLRSNPASSKKTSGSAPAAAGSTSFCLDPPGILCRTFSRYSC